MASAPDWCMFRYTVRSQELVFATVRQRAFNRRRADSQLKRWLAKVFRDRPTSIQRWIFGYPDAHPFLEAVVEATASLPPKTQQVFLMKWRDGYRRHHIAEHLKISVKTVDWHLGDANVRLEGLLGDYQPERDENWIVATNRLEEIANPEFSTNARERAREMSRDMMPQRVTGVMAAAWKDPDKKKRKRGTGDLTEYSRQEIEQMLPPWAPPSAAGVIAMQAPAFRPSFRFLALLIGAVRAIPYLYYTMDAQREDLAARVARALTTYLSGEASAEVMAAAEETLLADARVVELAGPLLAVWQLAPARTRDAEVDIAWADFQRRVGVSPAAPPAALAVARVEAAASAHRDFTVTHPRNKRWRERVTGLALLIVGTLLLWWAGAGFIAHGRGPYSSVMADAGFGFALLGVAYIQTWRVQSIRRSRGVLWGLAATVAALTMDLITLRGGWG